MNTRHHLRICLMSGAAAVLFVAPCRLTAQSQPGGSAKPRKTAKALSGGQHVRSIRVLTIPRATSGRAQAAVAGTDAIYVAGMRWTKEDKSNLWLWQIDRSGERLWEKPLARSKGPKEVQVVGLLPDAGKFRGAAPGVRVVYRLGHETTLAFFDSRGEIVWERHLGIFENTHGLIVDHEDNLFLFGTRMNVKDPPPHAWVARVTRLGVVLWKHAFRVDGEKAKDETGKAESAPPVPRGFYSGSFLFDAVSLEDGSVVLVGHTGTYNKLGMGPSKLWLLRIDRDGNRLAQAFIDDGRIFPAGRDLIAACGDGVIVPYTTNQLGEPENPNPLEYGMRLARFNAQLEKLWDKPLPSTSLPGAATITGPAPFVSLTAWGPLLIRGADDESNELWKARIGIPGYPVAPLAALRMGDDVVAVCNFVSQDSRDTDESHKVLLVFARPRNNTTTTESP